MFGGIADRTLATRTIERLFGNDIWTGWGLRTLSQRAPRFNPMSYHNGSIWPHDNALVAAGFSRYGDTVRAAQVLTALFDASGAIEDRRLPELFCGFPRAGERRPVPYPVACRPQAWAAGSLFLLLQAALGLRIEAWGRRLVLRVRRPAALAPASRDPRAPRGRCTGRSARESGPLRRGRRGDGPQGDVDIVVRK